MVNRVDVDVRISLPVARRASFAGKLLTTDEAQRAAERIAAVAMRELAESAGVVVTVQPPQVRRYPDPVPAGADTQAAETPAADHLPADHLPGADADAGGSGRDRLGADDTQRSAA